MQLMLMGLRMKCSVPSQPRQALLVSQLTQPFMELEQGSHLLPLRVYPLMHWHLPVNGFLMNPSVVLQVIQVSQETHSMQPVNSVLHLAQAKVYN